MIIFPKEIISLIFGFLFPEDLCRVSLVCNLWNHIAKGDNLWKHHLNSRGCIHSGEYKLFYILWVRKQYQKVFFVLNLYI